MKKQQNLTQNQNHLQSQCPINLCAGLSVGYEQAKNGGIIWQMVSDYKNKNPIVLGVGGRYDYMLSEYQ